MIAHFATGHWYESVLYFAPVLAVIAALWWSGRRADAEEASAERPGPPPER